MLFKVNDEIIIDPEQVAAIRTTHERLTFTMKSGATLEAHFSYHPDAEQAADTIRDLADRARQIPPWPPKPRQDKGDTCLVCGLEIPDQSDAGCGRATRQESCPASTEIPF